MGFDSLFGSWRHITRYLFLLVYFSGVAQLVEQLAVNQEALIRFQSGSIPEAGAKSNR